MPDEREPEHEHDGPSPVTPLVPVPPVGRRFAATRRVRWGDVDHRERLRLDAIARYLQDVANDDTRDAGFDPKEPWVVRRTHVEVVRPPRLLEVLTLTTFNGGFGSRWAERRTCITGDEGGHVEAASLWVYVDPTTGRPARLTSDFLAVYEEAAQGRTVKARLHHDRPPAGAPSRRWAVRSTDVDPLGHVNNAATWEPVEDELDRLGVVPAWAELEYPGEISPGETCDLVSRVRDDGLVEVWLTVDGVVRASARVGPRRPSS